MINTVVIRLILSKELSEQVFCDPDIFSEVLTRIQGFAHILNVDEFEIVDSEEKWSIPSIRCK